MSDLLEKISVREYLSEMVADHGLTYDAIVITSKRMAVTESTVLACLCNIPIDTTTLERRIKQAQKLELSKDYINGLKDALKLLLRDKS